MLIRLFKIILAVTLTLVVAYKIIFVNFAYHLSSQTKFYEYWHSNQADFLLKSAGSQLHNNPALALEIAKNALTFQPADARAYLFIGLVQELLGLKADLAMHFANLMGPRITDNQLELAAFWARSGDIKKTLAHWRVAIEMRPELSRVLFPSILRAAEDQEYLLAFEDLIKDDPKWWGSFFNYVIANQTDERIIRKLFQYRLATDKMSFGERKSYLDYLVKIHRYLEAYAIWLEGLSANELISLNYIFDGEFDWPPSGYGFGWRFMSSKDFELRRVFAYPNQKSPALRIEFYGNRPSNHHLVQQLLMLEPGRYALEMKFQAESLEAGEGLRWTISCSDQKELGRGSLMKGSVDWTRYSVSFFVPENIVGCEVQRLSLDIIPGGARPFEYQGMLWIDQVSLKKEKVDLIHY